jgi:quercetin dioxygenase-like cupin family protein
MSEAPPITVVQPGDGSQGDLGPVGVVFKLWDRDTGGKLAIVENPFPVGALVPPHLHTREDEYSIVTEGQVGFRSGDREVVLGPGGYITKPRRAAHHVERRAGAGPDHRGDQPGRVRALLPRDGRARRGRTAAAR